MLSSILTTENGLGIFFTGLLNYMVFDLLFLGNLCLQMGMSLQVHAFVMYFLYLFLLFGCFFVIFLFMLYLILLFLRSLLAVLVDRKSV